MVKILGACGYCGFQICVNDTHTNDDGLYHLLCKKRNDAGLPVPQYEKVVKARGKERGERRMHTTRTFSLCARVDCTISTLNLPQINPTEA